jgi:hypothetical protein
MSDIVVTFLFLVVVVIVVAVVLKMLMPKKANEWFLKNQRSNLRRASSEETSEPIEAAISHLVQDTYDQDVATHALEKADVAEQLSTLSKLRNDGSLTDEEFSLLKTKLIRGDEVKHFVHEAYDNDAVAEVTENPDVKRLLSSADTPIAWTNTLKKVIRTVVIGVLAVGVFWLLITINNGGSPITAEQSALARCSDPAILTTYRGLLDNLFKTADVLGSVGLKGFGTQLIMDENTITVEYEIPGNRIVCSINITIDNVLLGGKSTRRAMYQIQPTASGKDLVSIAPQ